jgi:hypothetical protein
MDTQEQPMKAKSKEQYIEAWTDHINQFIHVCMDADLPIDSWTELKEDMQQILEVAASKTSDKKITCGACTVAIGAHTNDENCKKENTNV